MLTRVKRTHLLLVVVILGLAGFQNCSTDLSNNAASMLATAESGLPFAYQTKIDTISYMSCSNVSTNASASAYYTFRVGAYNKYGIGLTDTFLAATKSFQTTDRATALSQSTFNAGAHLQLAVRQFSNFQGVLSGTSGSVTVGRDIGAFVSALDENPVASQLAALGSGKYLNNFAGNTYSFANNTGLVESSLNFSNSETLASSVRSTMAYNNYALALTYTVDDDVADYAARGPLGAIATSVYGTGYKVSFKLPPNMASADARVLSSVTEIDLSTETGNGGAWGCSSSDVWEIIRPEDVGSLVTCNETTDDYNGLTADQATALTAVRTVLRTEDWWVDPRNKCVVPKNTSADVCYGSRTGLANIVYGSSSCQAFANNTLGTCPHFVSVCKRSN